MRRQMTGLSLVVVVKHGSRRRIMALIHHRVFPAFRFCENSLMTRQPIDIRREIPWIGPPAVYLIDTDSEQPLNSELERLAYTVRHIPGAQVSDKRSMFERINEAFMFSQYAYPVFNWDAFDESLESLLQALDTPLAIIWCDSMSTLKHAPGDFLNAVRYLVNESVPSTCNYPEDNFVQFNVFFLGKGNGFRSHLE